MDFYKVIEQRESVRNYSSEKKVSDKALRRILNAGRIAPSAANRQPWTFVLISSGEKLKEVRTCYQYDWFQNAPHVLVVVGDKTKAWVRPYDGYNTIETDMAIALDHMILAAENEGVSTCWIVAYDYATLAKAIGLKKHETIFCITPLGYPLADYQKQNNKNRKSLEEIIRII